LGLYLDGKFAGGGHYVQSIELVLWVALSILTAGAATAGSADPPGNRTLSPYFFIENGDRSVDRFPLKETDVAVNISGVIAMF